MGGLEGEGTLVYWSKVISRFEIASEDRDRKGRRRFLLVVFSCVVYSCGECLCVCGG